MARAIDSEVAFRFLTEQIVKGTGAFSKGVNKGLNIARSAMRNPDAIPTLRARNGKWDWDTKGFPRPFCNRCGEEPWRRSNHQSDLPRYCPNCGAKMDKE